MVDAEESVLLVDADDRPLGSHGKLDAHRQGLRHRAFSIFLTDTSGRLLLQRRAQDKYHSGGLWSNACCGHPRVGESNLAAARRRLQEEMGLDVALRPAGRIGYQAGLANGWFENEIVHLFTATTDTEPRHDPAEIDDVRRVRPEMLRDEIAEAPDRFTAWFRIYVDAIPAVALATR